MRSLVLVAALGLFMGCASVPVAPTPELRAVTYSRPAPRSLERLRISRLSLDTPTAKRLSALPQMKSRWRSRWLAEVRADTMQEPPWTTRLYIFDCPDSQRCILIEAQDHASYGVDYQWLSEKLLFVRCWWGRIVSTDLVLDTDTAHPVYIEDANYFHLVYDQPRPTQQHGK